jgi:hypothetical protein
LPVAVPRRSPQNLGRDFDEISGFARGDPATAFFRDFQRAPSASALEGDQRRAVLTFKAPPVLVAHVMATRLPEED